MKLSRTWQGRLDRSQSTSMTFLRPAVLVLAAIAGLNVVWQFVFGSPVDVAGPARTVVNKSAVVSSFTQDFVSAWLGATAADADSLTQFVSVNPAGLKLPSTPAVVASAPTVVAVTLAGYGGEDGAAEVYSVVVGVNERPYESAASVRALYRVPVLWSSYGPRAASLPARIGGPGPGADLPLGYPTTLGASDPAFQAVSGFLTAYLTKPGGVERFTTSDSMLVGLGEAYQSVTVTALTATAAPATTPTEGQTARVLARVDAVTSQYAPAQLTYPITLRGVGGRWAVAAIDPAPVISGEDQLVPVVGQRGRTR